MSGMREQAVRPATFSLGSASSELGLPGVFLKWQHESRPYRVDCSFTRDSATFC